MNGEFNIWQVVAGIGIFLIGIQMLETALKNMMSRPFKLFLRKQTGNPLKAIAGGTIVTAVLQSSSAVNFMVLAFVSTGVLTMRNAFAVIMGTNLGTTLDSWIIATVGFKFDIEAFAYPIVGIAGLLIFIYEDRRKLHNILSFLIGFSFLFIGLGLMKDAVENDYIREIFGDFTGRSNWVFLLIGFVLTSVMQSSSATIAITLSILNQQLIEFDSAIAVVIGSEVGTSLKLVLGSLDGVAVKKRVAAGNLVYNLITTVIGFSLLQPISVFITNTLSVKDPLIGLVIFQTGINLMSVLLMLPFLGPYSRLFEKLFSDKKEHYSAFIYKTKPTVPESAIDLLEKETAFFIHRAMHFNLNAFDVEDLQMRDVNGFSEHDKQIKFDSKTFEEQYVILKEHHGEIQSFYIMLSKQSLSAELADEVEQIIAAVRSSMHASKCIKDIHADAIDLKNSSHDIKYAFYNHLKSEIKSIYLKLNEVLSIENKTTIANKLMELLDEIEANYKKNLTTIYDSESIHTISHVELATLININRELFTANKSMVMSLKSLMLTKELSESFSELPTYQA